MTEVHSESCASSQSNHWKAPVGSKEKLAHLRDQLFTASQTLTGDDLREFWSLINDVYASAGEMPRVGPLHEDALKEWADTSVPNPGDLI